MHLPCELSGLYCNCVKNFLSEASSQNKPAGWYRSLQKSFQTAPAGWYGSLDRVPRLHLQADMSHCIRVSRLHLWADMDHWTEFPDCTCRLTWVTEQSSQTAPAGWHGSLHKSSQTAPAGWNGSHTKHQLIYLLTCNVCPSAIGQFHNSFVD